MAGTDVGVKVLVSSAWNLNTRYAAATIEVPGLIWSASVRDFNAHARAVFGVPFVASWASLLKASACAFFSVPVQTVVMAVLRLALHLALFNVELHCFVSGLLPLAEALARILVPVLLFSFVFANSWSIAIFGLAQALASDKVEEKIRCTRLLGELARASCDVPVVVILACLGQAKTLAGLVVPFVFSWAVLWGALATADFERDVEHLTNCAWPGFANADSTNGIPFLSLAVTVILRSDAVFAVSVVPVHSFWCLFEVGEAAAETLGVVPVLAQFLTEVIRDSWALSLWVTLASAA